MAAEKQIKKPCRKTGLFLCAIINQIIFFFYAEEQATQKTA
jgi:hypothetical protein